MKAPDPEFATKSSATSSAGAMRCEAHGLLYDATHERGCVLCRRQQVAGEQAVLGTVVEPSSAPRWLRWVVPTVALVLVAAASFGWEWWRRNALQHVHLDGPFATEPEATYADCRLECAEVSETCDGRCARGEGADATCRHTCLNGLSECEGGCAHAAGTDLDPSAYSYGIGPVPRWFDLLGATLDLGPRLALCSADALTARVRVDGATGSSAEVVVATARANPDAEACAAARLAEVTYPTSSTAYTFVAAFDPRLDRGKLLLRRAEADLEVTKKAENKETIRQATVELWELKQKLAQRTAAPAGSPPSAAQTPASNVAAPAEDPAAPTVAVPAAVPMHPVFTQPHDDDARPVNKPGALPSNPGALINPRRQRWGYNNGYPRY